MTHVHVWLEHWEHMCCGDSRQIGDRVELKVLVGAQRNWEQRHYERDPVEDAHLVNVSGIVQGIFAHRTVLQNIAERTWRTVGYLPGIEYKSTDAADDEVEWTFEFVLDCDAESTRNELVTHSGEAPKDSPIHIGFFDDERTLENGFLEPFWFGYVEPRRPDDLDACSDSHVAPKFLDAADAVKWWRTITDHVSVDLGPDHERLWAGRAEITPPNLVLFNPSDPRARRAGAQSTRAVHEERRYEAEKAEKAATLITDGAEVRRRRSILGLTIGELATRANLEASLVESLENGLGRVPFDQSTWTAIAWALSEPWPQLRDRARKRGTRGGLIGGDWSPLAVADQWVKLLTDES